MAQIISASIDLAKIDPAKIVRTEKGGKFYNIEIIVNDQANKFGQNVSIATSQNKEQRAAKEKKSYIGNGKTVWKSESVTGVNQHANASEHHENDSVSSDDLPF